MGKMDIRISDLKQYYYCPRVVFYEYVLPVERKITYKMEKGRAIQEEIERLESRRKLKKYGLEKGERKFNVWLASKRLGLSGKLDMIIETEVEIYPVDFKYTKGRPYKNHLYQLVGYALLIEDSQQKTVQKGFVYLIPQQDAVIYEMTRKLKDECLVTIEEIKTMIVKEIFPDPPSQRAKCADCEFKNYCRDIW